MTEKPTIHAFVGLLHEIVDRTWGRAMEDRSVPSSETANAIIDEVISTHNTYAPDHLYVNATQGHPIAYLREVDSLTDNACWVVCAKTDAGAVPVFASR